MGSGDTHLQTASEQFLNLLLSRGLLLEKDDYREIVHPAMVWAFEKIIAGPFIGSSSIRRSLEQAAYAARPFAHEVLKEESVAYLGTVDLESKDNWYLQAVRDLLETLLANPSCTEGSAELAVILKKINRIQRAKPRALSRLAGTNQTL